MATFGNQQIASILAGLGAQQPAAAVPPQATVAPTNEFDPFSVPFAMGDGMGGPLSSPVMAMERAKLFAPSATTAPAADATWKIAPGGAPAGAPEPQVQGGGAGGGGFASLAGPAPVQVGQFAAPPPAQDLSFLDKALEQMRGQSEALKAATLGEKPNLWTQIARVLAQGAQGRDIAEVAGGTAGEIARQSGERLARERAILDLDSPLYQQELENARIKSESAGRDADRQWQHGTQQEQARVNAANETSDRQYAYGKDKATLALEGERIKAATGNKQLNDTIQRIALAMNSGIMPYNAVLDLLPADSRPQATAGLMRHTLNEMAAPKGKLDNKAIDQIATFLTMAKPMGATPEQRFNALVATAISDPEAMDYLQRVGPKTPLRTLSGGSNYAP